MQKEIFSDGVHAIHVTGNLVRIDLMSVQPQRKNEVGELAVEVQNRIIMPLESFLASMKIQENIIQELLEKGILKREEAEIE